jgi:hypothetical protein
MKLLKELFKRLLVEMNYVSNVNEPTFYIFNVDSNGQTYFLTSTDSNLYTTTYSNNNDNNNVDNNTDIGNNNEDILYILEVTFFIE